METLGTALLRDFTRGTISLFSQKGKTSSSHEAILDISCFFPPSVHMNVGKEDNVVVENLEYSVCAKYGVDRFLWWQLTFLDFATLLSHLDFSSFRRWRVSTDASQIPCDFPLSFQYWGTAWYYWVIVEPTVATAIFVIFPRAGTCFLQRSQRTATQHFLEPSPELSSAESFASEIRFLYGNTSATFVLGLNVFWFPLSLVTHNYW